MGRQKDRKPKSQKDRKTVIQRKNIKTERIKE